MVELKTKKQARAAGLRSRKELRYEVPLRDAEPTIVKGEAFYNPQQLEPLISSTEARRRGLTVLADAPIEAHLSARPGGVKTICYAAYRLSDCRPARKRKARPARKIDLLPAIFTVNKSAKRYRDAASNYYQAGLHGFAGTAKERKEDLYELKDAGIADALRKGRLSLVGVHGGLALYRGEGFCFHSTLVRKGAVPEQAASEKVFVEAKPRGLNEPRLKDAIKTLQDLPGPGDEFERLPKPRRERPQPLWVWRDDDKDFDKDDWDENLDEFED